MTDYAKKEQKILNKIQEATEKLDTTLDKVEESEETKVKHFIEQEKAIHEIKKIISDGKKLYKNEQNAVEDAAYEVSDWMDNEDSLVGNISNRFDKLDKTLSNISDDDNRVKSYIEQKKVLHEVKEIAKSVDKLLD